LQATEMFILTRQLAAAVQEKVKTKRQYIPEYLPMLMPRWGSSPNDVPIPKRIKLIANVWASYEDTFNPVNSNLGQEWHGN
jgi:hypothetical protein